MVSERKELCFTRNPAPTFMCRALRLLAFRSEPMRLGGGFVLFFFSVVVFETIVKNRFPRFRFHFCVSPIDYRFFNQNIVKIS